MAHETKVYATDRIRMGGDRVIVVEYVDDPCPSTGRPARVGQMAAGTLIHDLLAVIREAGRTRFTVKQQVYMPVLNGGRNPREKGQDSALLQEVVRRLSSGDWDDGADYVLPPIGC